MNKNRWMYTVQFNEVEQRWQLRRIDREEAYCLALSGHAIQAFDTKEEASRELSRIRSMS
jgi:hypothetical protein